VQPAPVYDPEQIDRALTQADSAVDAYRRVLKAGTDDLRQRFELSTPVAELVAGRAALVDRVLQHAWHRFFGGTDDIALVAVGGYGRGELHPSSDIDLMVLLDKGAAKRHKQGIETFLMFLWDMGLEVGHSVRTVKDCLREAKSDITVITNLVESRLLAGPPALYDAMREATGPRRIWPSDRFFEAKWKEQQDRHHKFHDTAYNLEPNVKEGPGGLRDIQMIGWVAKRHFGADTLHDLVGHGFLTESEYQTLASGQSLLWRVRFALHTLTGRREDRLLFDYQRTLARQFGYKDGPHNLAVEQFMQSYYRTIMELGRLNEMLLQLFQEAILYANQTDKPVILNKRFQLRRGFIEVRNDKIFEHYPFALLEIFLLLQQHPEAKGVRAQTIRLIRDHTPLIDDQFRNNLSARSLFMEILRQPSGVNRELHRMNRYGVLAAYLPAFAHIVGRMQYDLFHVYTVDEHSLFVIRNLRRLYVPKYQHELPLASEIAAKLPKPELLYLGGLFHDIAKGRGGDHSELGAEDAMNFCLHHGLSQYDSRLVAWLVRNHLIMSMTAQRKDISDPEVINEFAATVGDLMHLDYLYLLTVSDIRATNPEMWNSWKDALLRELYHTTKTALRRGLEQPIDEAERIDEIQQAARTLLHDAGMSDTRIDELWHAPSTEYFLCHTPEEILWHTQAIADARPEDLPLVLVRPQKQRGSTAIFIYGPAREHQFALTTAVLEQLGLTVVDARVIVTGGGYTLDTYLVLEDTGEDIQSEHRLEEIRNALSLELRKPEVRTPTVSRRPARQLKHFDVTTRVNFEQDPGNERTMMELVAIDRPGLLSRVGRAFMECGIRVQNARIATIGARTEDVFYITDLDNQPLTDNAKREQLQDAVIQELTQ